MSVCWIYVGPCQAVLQTIASWWCAVMSLCWLYFGPCHLVLQYIMPVAFISQEVSWSQFYARLTLVFTPFKKWAWIGFQSHDREADMWMWLSLRHPGSPGSGEWMPRTNSLILIDALGERTSWICIETWNNYLILMDALGELHVFWIDARNNYLILMDARNQLNDLHMPAAHSLILVPP